MNFSTWNTIIFGIIWIVNVSADYFRLKVVFSRGPDKPDPEREGLHKWGARGLRCHPFPPNSGDQLQPLVASSRGIPILSRIASAAQWAKTFFFITKDEIKLYWYLYEQSGPKERPSNFFFRNSRFLWFVAHCAAVGEWWRYDYHETGQPPHFLLKGILTTFIFENFGLLLKIFVKCVWNFLWEEFFFIEICTYFIFYNNYFQKKKENT